jgi:GTP cyclohydrolase I
MDKEKIQEAISAILKAAVEDINRPGLKDTPRRVADFYEEIFSGLNQNPRDEIKLHSAPNHNGMIIAKDLSFHSLCEHHLLPFFGRVHIAYLPKDDRITGFSRLARVVEVLAHRPQIQERLTSQIADALMDSLNPRGVLVIVEAEQLCLTMRGVKKPGSLTITTAAKGDMTKQELRSEALALIKGRLSST